MAPQPRVKPILVFRKPKGLVLPHCGRNKRPIPPDAVGKIILEYRLSVARPGQQRMRQRVAQSTGISVEYRHWNSEKQCIRDAAPGAETANDLLRVLLREAEDACLNLKVNKLAPSPARAKAIANGDTTLHETLLQSWQRWEQHQLERVKAGEIQPDTAKIPSRRLPLLTAWLKAEKLQGLLTKDLTAPLCRQFTRWLLVNYETVKSQDFANKCGRLLAECAACAVERGALAFNPIGRLKMPKPTRKALTFLEVEQVEVLLRAELPTAKLRRCRDAFLFICYTGFAYIDARTFDPQQHIRKGWVLRPRQKSEEQAHILLLPGVAPLLARYAPGPVPIPKNSSMNERLKELAAITHIPVHLTCHVGRRTCGMLLLEAGMSMESVSKWLGHASIKTTEKIYATVTQRRIEREARAAGLL